MPKTWKDWYALFVCLLIPQMAGVIGSVFTFFAIPLWYGTLTLPSFAPPNWVFGPVWTLLYILMGISLYIVWRARGGSIEKGRARVRGLWAFGVQITLNALWSVLFFGMRSPLAGLLGIGFLLIALIATVFFFFKVHRSAGYLLLPYLLWTSFASVLNGYIVFLN